MVEEIEHHLGPPRRLTGLHHKRVAQRFAVVCENPASRITQTRNQLWSVRIAAGCRLDARRRPMHPRRRDAPVALEVTAAPAVVGTTASREEHHHQQCERQQSDHTSRTTPRLMKAASVVGGLWVVAGLYETSLVCQHDRLYAVAQTELCEHPVYVGFHGRFADDELGGDVGVRQSPRDQLEHFEFAIGQILELRWRCRSRVGAGERIRRSGAG